MTFFSRSSCYAGRDIGTSTHAGDIWGESDPHSVFHFCDHHPRSLCGRSLRDATSGDLLVKRLAKGAARIYSATLASKYAVN